MLEKVDKSHAITEQRESFCASQSSSESAILCDRLSVRDKKDDFSTTKRDKTGKHLSKTPGKKKQDLPGMLS